MRLYLLTVEGTEQSGEMCTIAPSVPLQSIGEHDPKLIMPMAGGEVELRLPDGHVNTAIIASFGVDVWKDSEGRIWMNGDPSNPSLTLTIRCGSDIKAVPPGTEIWLSNARSSSTSETS